MCLDVSVCGGNDCCASARGRGEWTTTTIPSASNPVWIAQDTSVIRMSMCRLSLIR